MQANAEMTITGRIQPRVISWCAAHVRGRELDELLATGMRPGEPGLDPAISRRCEARAQILKRHRFRFALAQELEDILQLAEPTETADPPQRTPWTVDIQIAEVRNAADALGQIIAGLRARKEPDAHGISLALLLLRDGRSPLYDRHASGALRPAAERAVRALAAASPSAPHAGSVGGSGGPSRNRYG